MRGDEDDLARLPLGVQQDGSEGDLIEWVLEHVHRGSKFRSPFLSVSIDELKAWKLLGVAHRFKNDEYIFEADTKAYLARIDLSKLHPGQVIPFADFKQQKRLVGTRIIDDNIGWYFRSLGPDEVQPCAQASLQSEYVLVGRGFIPRHLFEPVRRSQSVAELRWPWAT